MGRIEGQLNLGDEEEFQQMLQGDKIPVIVAGLTRYGEKGTILWDYFKNEVKLFQNKENKWTTYKEKSFERNKMYADELKHFLRCINNEEKLKITNN